MNPEILHGWAKHGEELVREHPELGPFYQERILPELKKEAKHGK